MSDLPNFPVFLHVDHDGEERYYRVKAPSGMVASLADGEETVTFVPLFEVMQRIIDGAEAVQVDRTDTPFSEDA